MQEIFVSSFTATFLAVLKVFIVIIAAGLLVRRKVVSQEQIKSLSTVTINVLLPCFIFDNITRNFNPAELTIWWTLPLAGLAMNFAGLVLGTLFFWKDLPAKKNMIPLASIQNAGYLILPVGSILYKEQFDQFAMYCLFFTLSAGPVLWSFGKYLCSAGENEKLRWKQLITPPFVANLLALSMVFSGMNRYIPAVMSESVELLGRAAVPLANFVLGAVLGSIVFKIRPWLWDAARTMGVKLMIVPLLSVLVLYWVGLYETYPLMSCLLVLQASSAPATGLILIVRNYGGDEQKISSIMLVSYLACILTMPFWMAVWESMHR